MSEQGHTEDWKSRTLQCVGREAVERLASAHVLVVGLGGVGAWAAEQLVRAGVGELTLVDGDRVHTTNLNRQLPALHSTLGEAKTAVMGRRLKDIHPEVKLHLLQEFLKDERLEEVLDTPYDYVIDAIDTLSPKVFLIYHALQKGQRVVSSMGSGGKLYPAQVQSCDISKTYNCKLARMLRKKLHPLGVYQGFTAVYSPEEVPKEAVFLTEGEQNKKSNVGTISYMPAVFGCHCASVVIRQLIKKAT